MRVIGTVGLPGSGKGELAEVAREAGIPVVTMGDIIREECRARGLDPATDHGKIAKALREEEGDDAIAARSLPVIEDHLDANDVVVVDGLRSDVELDRFRDAFGDEFILVSVEAPFETRAERLGDRGRDESDTDVESLKKREARELDFGMGEAMDRADVVIQNTGTLDEYRETITRLFEEGPDALAEANP
ncbi:flagellar hook-basal body complex protein FliE [Haloferax sp. MBLA0076]|uniref:Flagellar hook-basal body complex protein FliE n=1 Tax=Haloferax litoreum TaxID=2666140 RepID=A0A6A8GDL1_9EURY|nr:MULTISPECIES: AAA family ATPase [Haloferax]KAB1192766.1 flagellar hook-basal body complex protein FliE [Haloferax sp. CBA1148]MRX21248.1 flagellar hook-basal body complex protein FliE [Haloferax litoreum]